MLCCELLSLASFSTKICGLKVLPMASKENAYQLQNHEAGPFTKAPSEKRKGMEEKGKLIIRIL